MLIDVVDFGTKCHFPAEAVEALQQAMIRLEQGSDMASAFASAVCNLNFYPVRFVMSWLGTLCVPMLYPQVNALLPAGNMKRFSADFDIVRACIDPDQDDRYRVFLLPPDVPVAEYPEKNTLQRNLKAWLLEGNTM